MRVGSLSVSLRIITPILITHGFTDTCLDEFDSVTLA